MKILVLLLSVLVLVLPVSEVSACAVCFGEKGNHVTDAISWSILFMLGLLALVIGGILAFFGSIIVRSARQPLSDEDVLAVIQPSSSHLSS